MGQSQIFYERVVYAPKDLYWGGTGSKGQGLNNLCIGPLGNVTCWRSYSFEENSLFFVVAMTTIGLHKIFFFNNFGRVLLVL